MADRPVVLLHGARQTGKTTLARAIAGESEGVRYVTLDDLTTLAAAQDDPTGFLAGFEGTVVLDEVQRVPSLFPVIKAMVDRNRQPGRFLLTGSANALMVPSIAESLVGRTEIVTLWPFSQGELIGVRETFIDSAFGEDEPTWGIGESELVDRVLRGGFPEATGFQSAERRGAWFGAYATTLLQRDVRDLANIEGLTDLPRLLSLIASRPMTLLNYAELSRNSGLAQTTLKRYFALFEAVFLVRTVRPWHANIGKRLVKSPKLMLTDSGLAAYLSGLDAVRLAAQRSLFGGLLESFVAMELTKQLGWCETEPSLYHFRTHDGEEVDLVLERRSGEVVGVEVKSSATVSASDFKGLKALAEAAGARFRRGFVLYTGREWVPFGPKLHALPIQALWSGNTAPNARSTHRRARRR